MQSYDLNLIFDLFWKTYAVSLQINFSAVGFSQKLTKTILLHLYSNRDIIPMNLRHCRDTIWPHARFANGKNGELMIHGRNLHHKHLLLAALISLLVRITGTVDQDVITIAKDNLLMPRLSR